MKRLFYFILALLIILVVPVSGFAASTDETIDPLAVYTYNSKIRQGDSMTAIISATSGYSSTTQLVATAQLQRKVNGVWKNFGNAVTMSGTGTSITASKNVTIFSGYEYRVKGTHSIGSQTKTSYSITLTF